MLCQHMTCHMRGARTINKFYDEFYMMAKCTMGIHIHTTQFAGNHANINNRVNKSSKRHFPIYSNKKQMWCNKCCQCASYWEKKSDFWKGRYLDAIDTFSTRPRHPSHEESNIRISNDKAKANQD